MWICKTKIHTSFINQGQVNKGVLYASLLLTSLHLGYLNNETLSITQGNSQSIVMTYRGTKQLLSGPLNYGIFIKHSVRRKRWLKSRVLYYNNSFATFNLSEITIARSGDVHPMPGQIQDRLWRSLHVSPTAVDKNTNTNLITVHRCHEIIWSPSNVLTDWPLTGVNNNLLHAISMLNLSGTNLL